MASGRIQEPSRLSEPQITDIKTIPLDQFTLLLADADNGKKYMERHEWEHVAHMHDTKKRPGYILWSEFLWPGDATTTGGNGDRLRKDLEKIFGVGQVQFSDTEGHDWIIIELAMGFAEHINPALKVRILEIFRKHGLKILYEGEEPVMDLETLSDEHKYALMMKWHTEAIQKMSTEITIVKETALQASETAHHANDTAVAAEQKADDALRKAALAFENVKWLSVEQWVIGEKLLRKFPEKTWSTLGKKLGDYCSLYNLEVKTFTVNGKPWPEEKFYPPEAFSWLLRQKNFLQKTMGW
jgi:hypothetical protein